MPIALAQEPETIVFLASSADLAADWLIAGAA
jgi:hypothetical protein